MFRLVIKLGAMMMASVAAVAALVMLVMTLQGAALAALRPDRTSASPPPMR